jgi:hypothetical protein
MDGKHASFDHCVRVGEGEPGSGSEATGAGRNSK